VRISPLRLGRFARFLRSVVDTEWSCASGETAPWQRPFPPSGLYTAAAYGRMISAAGSAITPRLLTDVGVRVIDQQDVRVLFVVGS